MRLQNYTFVLSFSIFNGPVHDMDDELSDRLSEVQAQDTLPDILLHEPIHELEVEQTRIAGQGIRPIR